MGDCIFSQDSERRNTGSRKVYEDEEVLAFHDIHPVAPVHFMLVLAHVPSMAELTDGHRASNGQDHGPGG
jgi:histidine triad (HIT) family protein